MRDSKNIFASLSQPTGGNHVGPTQQCQSLLQGSSRHICNTDFHIIFVDTIFSQKTKDFYFSISIYTDLVYEKMTHIVMPRGSLLIRPKTMLCHSQIGPPFHLDLFNPEKKWLDLPRNDIYCPPPSPRLSAPQGKIICILYFLLTRGVSGHHVLGSEADRKSTSESVREERQYLVKPQTDNRWKFDQRTPCLCIDLWARFLQCTLDL